MIVYGFFVDMCHLVIYLHDSSLIATSVTIVRGRENCHDLLIVLPLISFHHKLMCPRYEM